MPSPPETVVDIVRWRAAHQTERRAFTILVNGETEGPQLTYGELDRQARAIAAMLQNYARPGERAILIYPQSLDFVAAFLGCLYAGVVPVPTYLPSLGKASRASSTLVAIAKDAGPVLALTTSRLRPKIDSLFASVPGLETVRWLTTDDVTDASATDWRGERLSADDMAFLQYTSGSTSFPKGVVVTHGNLLSHQRAICEATDNSESSAGVTWLPMYHDMGLIGCVLQPIYAGFHAYVMSPAAFLQNPFRWLKAISQFRMRTSGGPNFAYDLCVAKITAEQREQLDLSSWKLAFCGAEPVRAGTIERFAAAFAPCGFRRQAFYPCYGLAEATLMVSGGPGARPPVVVPVRGEDLKRHRVSAVAAADPDATILVGCGRPAPATRVAIVDPVSCVECAASAIGEIWVRGPGVARGYWNRTAETAATFHAMIGDTGEGPFLRTGDLGFLDGGELFVTGRLKDLIIVDGRNHYPQDIELTVENSCPSIRPGCCAAFSIDDGGAEKLVIVAEADICKGLTAGSPDEELVHERAGLVTEIRRAVAEAHGLHVHAVSLLEVGSLAKTSSGKLQRSLCRNRFLSGSQAENAEYREVLTRTPVKAAEAGAEPGLIRSVEEIRTWLAARVTEHLGNEAEAVDFRQPFADYGLGSKDALVLVGDLERWLGRRVSPTLLYQYPTIDALASHLGGRAPARARADARVAARESSSEPIAIVGMSCRFPGGAEDPERLWSLLRDGVDAVAQVPEDRWDIEAYYDPDPAAPGKMYTRHGGFLGEVDRFDAGFFGISPREAAAMDPQHRLLLELAWEALERGCHNPDELASTRTGAFIGISSHDYAQLLLRGGEPGAVDAYFGTGNASSVAAGRLSYVLGLQGPSLAVDTACSSSLVAVHLACQSLRQHECDLALAGGVNLLLAPDASINFCRARMLAKDGRCKTFDAGADGYGRGEGGGMVVLQRLSDALSSGVPILAMIRGSGVNQDGRSNGLTAPNGAAQQALIRDVVQAAGLHPSDIGYVEAHGTGTSLGDPIELEALAAALGEGREDPLMVGSVKTNIGHLEAAAGIAGLIKAVLALEHRQIPPHLHLRQPNPLIAWDRIPIRVPTGLETWVANGGRRIAGVSSFGFSGTNAHVIVEEAPVPQLQPTADDRPAHLLCVSAKTPHALRELARRFAAHIASHPDDSLADSCFTASSCRPHHQHRAAFVAESRDELARNLDRYADGNDPAATAHGRLSSNALSAATGGIGAQLALSPPGNGASVWRGILKSLAELYVQGVDIDWAAFAKNQPRRKVRLPVYPFQRERFWIPSIGTRERAARPLLGRRLDATGTKDRIQFHGQISAERPSFLADHTIQGTAILSASAYLEMALAAATDVFEPNLHVLENVKFMDALPLGDRAQAIDLTLTRNGDTGSFEIAAGGTVRAEGTIRTGGRSPERRAVDPETLASTLSQRVPPAEFYRLLSASGYQYGPSFQCISDLWRRDGAAFGLVEPAGELNRDAADYAFHPCLLDGCFQVLAAAISDIAREEKPAPRYLVASIDRLTLHERPGVKLWTFAALRRPPADSSLTADLTIYDEHGSEIASIEGLRLKERQERAVARAEAARDANGQARGQHELRPQALLHATHAERQQLLFEQVRTDFIEILGLDPAFPLHPDSRLRDLGLDSLMAMDLMDRLGNLLGFPLPATLLSDIATVEELIGLLDRQLTSAGSEQQGGAGLGVILDEIEALPEGDVERLLHGEGAGSNGAWERVARLSAPKMQLLLDRLANAKPAAAIHAAPHQLDLAAEAVLPPGIDGTPLPANPSGSPEAILLTGATGYLGTFLLAELLRLTEARIFCLVRSRSLDEGRRRLERELVRRFPEARREVSRIVPVLGNLGKPLLGVGGEDFHALARQIDVIYHSGAVVNFLESYQALKPVNVLAAEAVLRLATTVRLKAVHFVSSFSVFMSPHYVNAGLVPEQDGPEHWHGLPNGYAQSKWVADRLMHQAMSRGIPVSIYRPGFISGHSRTGECKLEDLPQRLIKGCIQLGMAPQLSDAALDMTPVDFVGSALVHLSRRNDSSGKAFNLVNPAPIAWDRLVEWMRSFGYPIEVVPFPEWLRGIRGADESNALHALRGLVELTPKELLANLPPFERRNTIAGLSDSSISCPSVEELLDAYFSFFIESGFLNAPAPLPAHAFS